MTTPYDIPTIVWSQAMVAVSELNLVADISVTDNLILVESHARAILAERERCRGVANERAAQLIAGINLQLSEETKAGWAGQMVEALMIEQRISQGHQPTQSIEIEGLHKLAEQAGFKHAN